MSHMRAHTQRCPDTQLWVHPAALSFAVCPMRHPAEQSAPRQEDDPITLEPLSELDLPPFELVSGIGAALQSKRPPAALLQRVPKGCVPVVGQYLGLLLLALNLSLDFELGQIGPRHLQ